MKLGGRSGIVWRHVIARWLLGVIPGDEALLHMAEGSTPLAPHVRRFAIEDIARRTKGK